MTAMTDERPRTQQEEEALLEFFLALDPPEGIRVEFIEGEIVVSPAPDGDHEDAIELVLAQVYEHSKVRMQFAGNKGIKLPRGGRCPKNYAIPDATFAPREMRLYRGAPTWMEPDGIAMVVEVTSSKPDGDRIAKRHCYARAGLPLYLLVDRDQGTVTLFSDPTEADYSELHTADFGKPITLPEPFAFDLDTSDFL
ncbi:Uma2 family endonuclease [Streptomyces orinoci]|uniref:Uma2 family endonuclease n=1 Tax=Streptomyces orinoci TaxID=67339 RepID=A0ABV3K1D3_STRON|nr:Uma2 family endonuclease [Streptomyces orinoci]